jgi:nitrogen regulatory protein P-II 1
MYQIERDDRSRTTAAIRDGKCGVMKLVTATVPESVLDDLRDALVSIGIKGMTISAAMDQLFKDMDAEHGHSRPCAFPNAREIVLETVVSAAIVNEVVKAISAACNEAPSGGIPILVSDVTLSVRVRNFELVTEG